MAMLCSTETIALLVENGDLPRRMTGTNHEDDHISLVRASVDSRSEHERGAHVQRGTPGSRSTIPRGHGLPASAGGNRDQARTGQAPTPTPPRQLPPPPSQGRMYPNIIFSIGVTDGMGK